MHTHATKTNGLLIALALAAIGLAGCVGDTPDVALDGENAAPEAALTVNRPSGWSTETFRFDAAGSRDTDGSITEYRFAFGDGTETVVSGDDEPHVTHAYAHGGEYIVTLTVRDDGGENLGALTDTALLTVSVNERQALGGQVVDQPANNQTSTYTVEFEVFNGADRAQVDLDVASLLPAGSSEIRVRLVDPEGVELDAKTLNVDAGQTEQAVLTTVLATEGTHTMEVVAESGAAAATGELRVYYDEDLFDDASEDPAA